MADKFKAEMIEKLYTEHWSLHFYGKHIGESEYQVVVLKKERTKVKLATLRLKDGKTKTIALEITKVVEFN